VNQDHSENVRDAMPSAAQIEQALSSVLEQEGIDVVDVIYRKEGGRMMLRVFLDTPEGVTVAICTRETKRIKMIPLIMDLPYDYLEVSSPGADRVIKKDRDFERFQGHTVQLTCRTPYRERKRFTGRLVRRTAEAIELTTDGETLAIPRALVAGVRLQP
jgi:ribosome maturation factor RimP